MFNALNRLYNDMQQNTLSDILSAEDGAPVFVPQPAYESFSGGTDPLAPKPNIYMTAAVPAAASAPAVSVSVDASTTGITQAQLDAIKPAGGLEGAWYSVRNFFMIGIPGLFTSASGMLRRLVGAPTTETTTDARTGATSTATASSSWLVYVFLAGAAAAVFFAVKGKGKGGKSFLPKLGGKSSIKLR